MKQWHEKHFLENFSQLRSKTIENEQTRKKKYIQKRNLKFSQQSEQLITEDY